jgi:hypothetical protein
MSFRSCTFSMVCAGTAAFWLAGAATASAACYSDSQKLPAQAISDFTGAPGKLLADAKNADGGADLIASVRDLVASDPAVLPAIIGLLGSANPSQRVGIGTGLGQAANTCSSDPANLDNMKFAADIQTQLALSNADDAKTSFAAVTGNAPIRAVAAGGGVSGGSSGGFTGSLSSPAARSTFTAFTSTSVPNVSNNFLTSSTSGIQSISSQSVSP